MHVLLQVYKAETLSCSAERSTEFLGLCIAGPTAAVPAPAPAAAV